MSPTPASDENTDNERPIGTVLIIDDQKMNRSYCRTFLGKLNLVIHCAKDGFEGIRLAQKVIPDLILLDLIMPGMDGFEVLRLLKQNQGLKSIPVLVLSVLSRSGEVEKALQMGADDYVQKPFSGTELVARSKKLLQARIKYNRIEKQTTEG